MTGIFARNVRLFQEQSIVVVNGRGKGAHLRSKIAYTMLILLNNVPQ